MESPVTVKVENKCGAPDPSLRLSGIQDDKRVAVQDDRRQASSMVTRNVFLSTSRCHSEQSEESGVASRYNEPGWCFRSFADAQDDKRDGQEDKGTVRRTKGTVRRTKGRSGGQRDVRSYPLTSYFVQ